MDDVNLTAEQIADHAETRTDLLARLSKAGEDFGAGFRDLVDLVKGDYEDDDEDKSSDDDDDDDDQVGSDDMEKGGPDADGYVDATELFLKINADLEALRKGREDDARVIAKLSREVATLRSRQETMAKGMVEGFIGLKTDGSARPAEVASAVPAAEGADKRLAKSTSTTVPAAEPDAPEFTKADLAKGMSKRVLHPSDISYFQKHGVFDADPAEHARLAKAVRGL